MAQLSSLYRNMIPGECRHYQISTNSFHQFWKGTFHAYLPEKQEPLLLIDCLMNFILNMFGFPPSKMSFVNAHREIESLEHSQVGVLFVASPSPWGKSLPVWSSESYGHGEIVRVGHVPILKGGDGDGNGVKSVTSKTAVFKKSPTSPLNQHINFSVINRLITNNSTSQSVSILPYPCYHISLQCVAIK